MESELYTLLACTALISLFSFLAVSASLRAMQRRRNVAQRDAEARLQALVGHARQIATGREQRELQRERLEESAEAIAKLRELLTAAPDGVVIVNSEGCIVMADAQACRLFGYSEPELFGEPVEILMPERERAGHEALRREYLDSPHMRGMPPGVELRGRRRDGSEFPVEVRLRPLHTKGGLLIMAMIRDLRAHGPVAPVGGPRIVVKELR